MKVDVNKSRESLKESRENLQAYLGIAVKHLNISVRDFWNLTLFEYIAIYDVCFGHLKEDYMTIDELERMKLMFPDEVKK